MKKLTTITTILELAGILLIVVGIGFQFGPALALIAAGIGALVLAWRLAS